LRIRMQYGFAISLAATGSPSASFRRRRVIDLL
jgi:hypothetical protein